MGLSNLSNYTWRNGTQDSPVNLSRTEFTGLINLIETEDITKDIRGYIHPIDSITMYQKYIIDTKCPNLVLVNPSIESTIWDISLSSSTVREGSYVNIITQFISCQYLKYRITEYIFSQLDGITEEAIKSRIHIDTTNGRIYIDDALENVSWNCQITIEWLEIYKEWDVVGSTPKVTSLTIQAIAISSATVTAPESVKLNTFFTATVNLAPEYNTKKIIETNGDRTKGIYIDASGFNSITRVGNVLNIGAPDTPTERTLEVVISFFGTTGITLLKTIDIIQPVLQFVVTASDDDPDVIASDILVTKPNGSTITVHNGDNFNVLADGNEEYQISCTQARGYDVDAQSTVIPIDAITTITISYIKLDYGIYAIYEDDSKEISTVISERGYLKANTNLKAILILDSNCSFVINQNYRTNNKKFATVNDLIPGVTTPSNAQLAVGDFNGYNNTLAVLNYYSPNQGTYAPAATNVHGRTITINGTIRTGYIPACGETKILIDNIITINDIRNLANWGNIDISKITWLSTQFAADKMFVMSDGVPTAGPYPKSNEVPALIAFKY